MFEMQGAVLSPHPQGYLEMEMRVPECGADLFPLSIKG